MLLKSINVFCQKLQIKSLQTAGQNVSRVDTDTSSLYLDTKSAFYQKIFDNFQDNWQH